MAFHAFLEQGLFLIIWGATALISLIILIYDLQSKNTRLGSFMKLVWLLTVAYASIIGLLAYYLAGRKQILKDTTWRKGLRSVAHCYSGCGAGEIIGVLIAAGLLALGNWPIAIITFTLAYLFGYTLTVLPLMQDGIDFKTAMKDALYSESASIFVMEVVAIGVDLLIAGNATIAEPLFWSSLIISLSAGLIAAYPVNIYLIRKGIKEGMHNPKHAHH